MADHPWEPRFSAPTLAQLVNLVAWTCLDTTPFNQKNALFARFFRNQDDLEDLAQLVSLSFPPGLFDVLQAATPPTLDFFRSLTSGPDLCWGVYAIVLEHPQNHPRLYIGSATSIGSPTACGVKLRFRHYETRTLLPRYVQASIDEGYTITSKGLLCWTVRPQPALYYITRLLFLIVEATFSYIFWAMKATRGDYGMSHIRFWDLADFDYTGLCSHPCLNEGICGQFDMPQEDLEIYAREIEEKRENRKAAECDWHYYQMHYNYDEYISAAHDRVKRSRANNPERHRETERKRAKKVIDEKTYTCETCEMSFSRPKILLYHLESAAHLRRVEADTDNPLFCKPCNYGVAHKSNWNRHIQTVRHKDNLAIYNSRLDVVQIPDPPPPAPSRSDRVPDATKARFCAPCAEHVHNKSNWSRHIKTKKHLDNVIKVNPQSTDEQLADDQSSDSQPSIPRSDRVQSSGSQPTNSFLDVVQSSAATNSRSDSRLDSRSDVVQFSGSQPTNSFVDVVQISAATKSRLDRVQISATTRARLDSFRFTGFSEAQATSSLLDVVQISATTRSRLDSFRFTGFLNNDDHQPATTTTTNSLSSSSN